MFRTLRNPGCFLALLVPALCLSPATARAVDPFAWIRPAGGEIFIVGSTQELTWSGGTPGGTVDIYIDNLNLSTRIFNDIPNTGSINWIVPGCSLWQTGDHRFRIEEPAGTGVLPAESPTVRIERDIYIVTHVSDAGIGIPAIGPECSDFSVDAPLSTSSGPFFYVFIFAVEVSPSSCEGIAGMQWGIQYDNGDAGSATDGDQVDIFNWTSFGNQQITTSTWPEPGSGITLVWDPENDCQYGGLPISAGYFYMAAYSADRFQITGHPADGLAKIASCRTAEINIGAAKLGSIGFSDGSGPAGCLPCDPTSPCVQDPIPVVTTTWGGIKSLFD